MNIDNDMPHCAECGGALYVRTHEGVPYAWFHADTDVTCCGDPDTGDYRQATPYRESYTFQRTTERVELISSKGVFLGWIIRRAPWHPGEELEAKWLQWHVIDEQTAFLGYYRTRLDAARALMTQHNALLGITCDPPAQGV